jgi:hypothetical protein
MLDILSSCCSSDERPWISRVSQAGHCSSRLFQNLIWVLLLSKVSVYQFSYWIPICCSYWSFNTPGALFDLFSDDRCTRVGEHWIFAATAVSWILLSSFAVIIVMTSIVIDETNLLIFNALSGTLPITSRVESGLDFSYGVSLVPLRSIFPAFFEDCGISASDAVASPLVCL